MPSPMQVATSQAHRRGPLGLGPTRCSVLGLCALLFACVPGAQPAGQEPAPPRPFTRQQIPFDGPIERDPAFAARQLRALNVDRQKALVTDTDRLLKLARELNTEMETGNPGALTQVELRKLAEIEKLARNVKQRMSISFVGGLLPLAPDAQWTP